MRLLYKPFGIIGAIIAARLGRKTFDSIWAKIDDAPPPRAGTGQGTVVKVVGAQALRAGVMAGSAAAVDRAFAHGFHYFIGIWPKKPPKPEDTTQES
jgi:Protein of unknown function (DUF4235)